MNTAAILALQGELYERIAALTDELRAIAERHQKGIADKEGEIVRLKDLLREHNIVSHLKMPDA